jgi:hypothetical protein
MSSLEELAHLVKSDKVTVSDKAMRELMAAIER